MYEFDEQPLSEREREILSSGYELYDLFHERNMDYKARVRVARKIALIEDTEQDAPNTPSNERTPQLHTLRSTLVNCIADQMDNVPEAILRPERPDTQGVAEDLTDIVSRVMDINCYDEIHRLRVEDNFVSGTSVTQIVWDPDMARGKGDIALLNCPVESIEWDPQCEDIQDGRAIFRGTWHPRQYYKEHFPDAEKYIRGESRSETDDKTDSRDESILLLEYWYRKYNAKTRKYCVQVAYLAGYALLYSSEADNANGLYLHGMYPFVFDVYTRKLGSPVGNGMVMEFAPMQRAINRYAKYIDENARASAKMRLLVNSGAGLQESDLADWNKQIIKGDSINDNAVRWFQSSPLSSQVNIQMNNFMDMLKQDSGQNQFNRGEGGLGVTAATAIQSLQEAGGKTTRFRTNVFKYGYGKIVEQVLWMIRQFYKKDRKLYITGRKDDAMREVAVSSDMFGPGDVMPYAVRVQVQRRNPLRIQAENETIMNAANVLAQGNMPLDPVTLIGLLNMDGKDRVMHAIQNEQQGQMQQMQLQSQQMQQAYEQQAAEMQEEMNGLRQALSQQAATLADTTVHGNE